MNIWLPLNSSQLYFLSSPLSHISFVVWNPMRRRRRWYLPTAKSLFSCAHFPFSRLSSCVISGILTGTCNRCATDIANWVKIDNGKGMVDYSSLLALYIYQWYNTCVHRRPFSEFLFQFRFVDLGIAENKEMDPRQASQALLERAKIGKTDWQIGKTMVFMKPQGMKDMAKKQREQMAAWEPLVTVVEAMAARKFVQEEIAKLLPGLVRFQAHARRYDALAIRSGTNVCCLQKFGALKVYYHWICTTIRWLHVVFFRNSRRRL